MSPNPVPEYKGYDPTKYKLYEVMAIRHNIPQRMMEDYVYACIWAQPHACLLKLSRGCRQRPGTTHL